MCLQLFLWSVGDVLLEVDGSLEEKSLSTVEIEFSQKHEKFHQL